MKALSLLLIFAMNTSYAGPRQDFEANAINALTSEQVELIVRTTHTFQSITDDALTIELDSTEFPRYDESDSNGNFGGVFFLSNKDYACRTKIKTERNTAGKLKCVKDLCYSACFKKTIGN